MDKPSFDKTSGARAEEPAPQCRPGERSEPGRNGGAGSSAANRPDPEVPAKPVRRRFNEAYKWRIVQEADRCTHGGEVGALLRREGLYSSQLSTWRKQFKEGALEALRDDKRGRKLTVDPLEKANRNLRRQLERTQQRLQQAEAIIDIQKKVSEILGTPLPNENIEGSS